jgi:hypothetical protein
VSAWKGDLSGLKKLGRNLGRLAAVPSRAAADASERIQALIDEEFANEADPYGTGWAQLADATVERKGHDAILYDTGTLRDTVRVRPLPGAGIAIELEDYAGFHQTGAPRNNMPARPVLPGEGMPDTWSDAIKAAAEQAFGETMGGE